MKIPLLLSAGALVLIAGHQPARAGETIDFNGAMACVNDKWEETEVGKGHKQVSYAGRCVVIPDDPKGQKHIEDCVGNYEYMPDSTWKSAGTCTVVFKGDEKVFINWEEGSHMKDYVYTFAGGTGKYDGAKGGGTYKIDELSSTLFAGRKTGKLELR